MTDFNIREVQITDPRVIGEQVIALFGLGQSELGWQYLVSPSALPQRVYDIMATFYDPLSRQGLDQLIELHRRHRIDIEHTLARFLDHFFLKKDSASVRRLLDHLNLSKPHQPHFEWDYIELLLNEKAFDQVKQHIHYLIYQRGDLHPELYFTRTLWWSYIHEETDLANDLVGWIKQDRYFLPKNFFVYLKKGYHHHHPIIKSILSILEKKKPEQESLV